MRPRLPLAQLYERYIRHDLEAAKAEVDQARRALDERQERAHAVQLEVLKLT